MPYHVFRHLSAITAVRPKPRRRRGGWGRGGRRKFYLRVELIKCIDPNEGEALGGREGGREGWGIVGRRTELIKCIDRH